MKLEKLESLIPYVVGQKKHVVSMQPYNAITLAMPGAHQNDTPVPGADFVVMVDDDELGWVRHRFTHTDIFKDVELKRNECPQVLGSLMDAYIEVILGADPEKFLAEKPELYVGLHPHTFLFAVQCLGVCENRRFERFNAKFGGKYLPLRFAAGIAEGLWNAVDAANMQRKGRPGVEILEKIHGLPTITKGLML